MQIRIIKPLEGTACRYAIHPTEDRLLKVGDVFEAGISHSFGEDVAVYVDSDKRDWIINPQFFEVVRGQGDD